MREFCKADLFTPWQPHPAGISGPSCKYPLHREQWLGSSVGRSRGM